MATPKFKYDEKVLVVTTLSILVLYLMLLIAADANPAVGDATQCQLVKVLETDSGKSGPTLLIVGGTHGNELAGTVAMRSVMKEFQEKKRHLSKGKIQWVPAANPCGLARNERNIPGNPQRLADLNRNYMHNGGCLGPLAKQICPLVRRAQFVLDFHEGWGFHKVHSTSYGSTLIPGTTSPSKRVAKQVVEALNDTIAQDWKQFEVLDVEAPDGTLRAYCNVEQVPYILVETSGQNDIQPLNVRQAQCETIIKKLLALTENKPNQE
tara:strand:- start:17800 stop:18597 length:798 start_codon:yes stop_codon:yes gene_type:complete